MEMVMLLPSALKVCVIVCMFLVLAVNFSNCCLPVLIAT